ncbi:MAG: glycosyltransferase family 1 protein [Opitutaceae bacterium]|nr:glycosyltransferase family 1 protein [Opitutaceae bacterium]
MKLALVTETYPPEVNGVAMTLSRLVAGLRARGHEVEVVRPRQRGEDARATPDFLVPGMAIPFYDALRVGLPTIWRLEERWRVWRPDVVHVATEGPLGLAAVTLAYLRWFHNRTRLTLAPTRQMVGELADARFRGLSVMARGVDTALFDPAKRSQALRATWGAAPEDPVALYVGRLAAEKNLGLAVEAFLRLRARAPRAKFVLVGDGPAREALARAHPEFHYAGMRRGEELAAHYASGDLFLFASVTETFGNVVTEAMASGLVTLSYDYAATREHVRDGRNGYAAAYDKREDFFAGVERAWSERSRWPEVAQAARRTATSLTWASVVARFESDVRAATGVDAP